MKKRSLDRAVPFLLTVLFAVAALHCGSGTRPVPREPVRIPPRVDLASLEKIGVVEFRSTEDGEIGRLATQRFTDSARRDQGLVRMLDLGPETEVLQSVGRGTWEPEAYRALGSEHEVRTLLLGELTFSKARPGVRIARDLGSGSLSMQVRATLAVRLVEAESGASIWSRTASATGSLANLDVRDGDDVRVATGDPASAYDALVDNLVAQVTKDFHVYWERR